MRIVEDPYIGLDVGLGIPEQHAHETYREATRGLAAVLSLTRINCLNVSLNSILLFCEEEMPGTI